MSKIYIDKKDKKEFINNLNEFVSNKYEITQTITFIKKYYVVYEEVTKILLMPIDLLNIIFNYVNEYYTLTYTLHYDDFFSIGEFYNMFIKYNDIDYYFRTCMNFGFNNEIEYMLSIYDCDQLYGFSLHNNYVEYNAAILFNHFMRKYYNKQNYIDIPDTFNKYNFNTYNSRKELLDLHAIIEHPKILKHLIIILKIFIDIVRKVFKKIETTQLFIYS